MGILDFNKFSAEQDLINEFLVLAEELNMNITYEEINEKLFNDIFKNKLSKIFLGSMSKINMMDRAMDGILDSHKKIIDKRNKYEDEVSIEDNLRKYSIDPASDSRKREIKTKEINTFVKNELEKIKKLELIIKKIIDNNQRRNNYYLAKKADINADIAEYEYSLAKKRASAKELAEYEKKLKMKREEAEKLMKQFQDKQSQDKQSQDKT